MRKLAIPALACVLYGCSSGSSSGHDAGMSCDCNGRICGTVCGNSCGVCPSYGVCASDGLSCRAALPIGSPCTQDLDCGDGLTCITQPSMNAPGGYCSAPCGGGFTCPSSSVCELAIDGTSICLATCSASMPCRASEGYECNSQGYCPACVPQCDAGACGDDGCGGQCGQTTPSVPACNTADQVCSNGACATAFTVTGNLDNQSGAMQYQYGLFDTALLEVSGYVIILGGREVYEYPNATLGAVSLSSVAVFDPTTDMITSTWPAMRVDGGIAKPQAAVLNNQIYVAGGITDPEVPDGGFENDVPQPLFFVYDGAQMGQSNWNANISQVPTPFPEGSALVPLNGYLYLIGGDIAGTPTTRVDLYDPTADEWDPTMSMPVSPPPQRTLARTRFAAATDGLRIYVIGGWDGMNALDTVEIFDGTMWKTSLPLPHPVVDATATVANDAVYIFGGRLGPNPDAEVVGDIQMINLDTYQTAVIGRTSDGPGNTILSGQAAITLETGHVLLVGGFGMNGTMYLGSDDVLSFSVPTNP